MAGIMDSFNQIAPFDSIQHTPELTQAMQKTMSDIESGGRAGVVSLDSNQKPSIGLGQWNDTRAQKLLERIRTADPSVAMQYIAEQDKIDNEYILREKDNISKLLSSDIGVATQKKQLSEDMSGYKAIAEKWGVQGAPAQILVSDLIHRYGAGGARQFVNKEGTTSLSQLYDKLKAYEDRGAVEGGKVAKNAEINSRRFSMYATSIGREAGAIMDLVALGKEAQKMKGDAGYNFEPALHDRISPEVKVALANAIKVPVPSYLQQLTDEAAVESTPYESPSLAAAQSIRESLKAQFLPKQEEGKPFNFGGLIQLLFQLFEG